MELTSTCSGPEGAVVFPKLILPTFPEQGSSSGQDVIAGLRPPEASNQLGFKACLTDLRNGWESMTPRSRLLFLGSGVLSAAVFGYVTAQCGPIPSLRKMISGLPEYIAPENRAWLRYSAGNVLSTVKGSVNPRAQACRQAGANRWRRYGRGQLFYGGRQPNADAAANRRNFPFSRGVPLG